MDFNKTLLIKNLKQERFSEIKEFLSFGLIHKKVILAGGALRTLLNPEDEVEDFDLFLISENIIEIRNLKSDTEAQILKLGGEKIFQCPKDELRSYRLKGKKIQIIALDGRMYDSPHSVINSFDINAGRIAYDGETLYLALEAVKDLRLNSISLHKIPFPLATCKRIARYGEKGFQNTDAFQQLLEYVYESGQQGVEVDFETRYVD